VSDPGQPPARPRKGATAFRTIGEVAEELDLPTHVLRFWETKFPQLNPVKRSGGRRYYRPEDILLLRRIRDWLYRDGYTIRGVQQLLDGLPSRGAAMDADPGATAPLAAGSDTDAGSSFRTGMASGPDAEAADRSSAAAWSGSDRAAAALDPELQAELEEIRRELLQARALLDTLLQQSRGS
jgi:DNA-binding transcriptional MerR regulator